MLKACLGLVMMALWPLAAHADIPPVKSMSAVAQPVVVPNSTTTTRYDPAAGFPDRNGPFSAMMVIIPQAELTEFEKTDGGERSLSKVSRSEVGAVLAVKFVFAGVMPDWNGNANVSYDLKVIAPNGKIYDGSDYSNLDALRAQVGDGHGVFDNRSKVVLMQFEDKDLPGTYTLKGVIRDNVAGREIALETSVDLLAKTQTVPIGPASSPIALPGTTTTAAPAEATTPAKSVKRKKSRRHKRKR